jgi:hypothetical protein
MLRDGWSRRIRSPKWALRFACALVVASGLAAGDARADKITEAEELFRRAKALMAENKYREACPLLEESERLDPQMGTLLNLAICHENIGKIASAWGEFRAVEQQARAANREDRVKLARERAAKLEPRLSRLKIVVPPEAKVEGLVVKVDGEEKGEPLWEGFAVDPGTLTVEVSAPGKKTASLEVKVDKEGALVPVMVPVLENEVVEKPPPPGPSDAQYEANRSRMTTGLIVGGVGLGALAAGAVFGVLAVMGDNDAEKTCPQPCFAGSREAADADSKTDRALVFANMSNIAIPIGLIVTAIGGYLVLSAGPTSKPASAFVAPTGGGGVLGARW